MTIWCVPNVGTLSLDLPMLGAGKGRLPRARLYWVAALILGATLKLLLMLVPDSVKRLPMPLMMAAAVPMAALSFAAIGIMILAGWRLIFPQKCWACAGTGRIRLGGRALPFEGF